MKIRNTESLLKFCDQTSGLNLSAFDSPKLSGAKNTVTTSGTPIFKFPKNSKAHGAKLSPPMKGSEKEQGQDTSMQANTIQLYDNFNAMPPLKGNKKKVSPRIRTMRSEHIYKELDIPSFEGRPWDEELYITRIATLSMMEDAVEAKISLENTNKKLLEEIAERTRSEKITQVLYAISNAAQTAIDVEELIGIIRQELGTLIDTTNFYVAFYNAETGLLSASSASDERDFLETWPAEKSLTGIVIRENKSKLFTGNDILEMNREGIIDIIGSLPQVWMGVPLQVDGIAGGAFVIQNYYDVNAYTARDLDMLEFISNQISISIQRKKTVQHLQAALLKAEENDRLKTAFLHNISHDIRTPMNAIVGFSGFLNDPDLKAGEMQEYTEIICNATHQLLSIIEDIINISTLEAGQEILIQKETNVNALLNALNKQFQAKIIQSEVELHINSSLPIQASLITTDETKLLQIMTNQLNNACKFTRKGKVTMEVEVKNNYLEFRVQDTGIGIDKSMHQAIFERFRQADGNIAREFGGTGLGLSISKAYVVLLGGKIWVNSEPGMGSTFCFTIPYLPVNTEMELHKQTTEVEMIAPDQQKTILIAEDEKFNYMLISEMFKGMNAKLIWAKNGWEVLQVCHTGEKIDLVLMDMKMPVMDGFEATQMLRGFYPEIPIVAQTAYASEKEKQRILECGCNEMITKPFDVNQFKSIVNKYLSFNNNHKLM